MHAELDPATYGLTIWDLDREFLTGGLSRARPAAPRRDPATSCATRTAARSAIEYMHIQDTDEQRWIQEQVEGVRFTLSHDELRHLLSRLNAAEAFEKFLATKYVGAEALRSRGCRDRDSHPRLDPVAGRRRRTRRRRARHGPPRPSQRAREHRRQDLRPDLQGVRGLRRSDLGAGLRRREVPPRRVGQVREPAGADIEVELAAQPSRISRRSIRWCSAWCAPARTSSIRRAPTRSSRPDARRRRVRRPGRRGRVPQHERHLRAIGSAARSTSSSTTSSVSRPRPSTPAPRSTAPTWPR